MSREQRLHSALYSIREARPEADQEDSESREDFATYLQLLAREALEDKSPRALEELLARDKVQGKVTRDQARSFLESAFGFRSLGVESSGSEVAEARSPELRSLIIGITGSTPQYYIPGLPGAGTWNAASRRRMNDTAAFLRGVADQLDAAARESEPIQGEKGASDA